MAKVNFSKNKVRTKNGIFTVLHCKLQPSGLQAVSHNRAMAHHHLYPNHLRPFHLRWPIFSLCSMTQLIQSKKPVNLHQHTVLLEVRWRMQQILCEAILLPRCTCCRYSYPRTLDCVHNHLWIRLLTPIKAQLPK